MSYMETPEMSPRHIVVEADLFVSQDLCEILREADPQVPVLAVPDLSAACALLSDGGPVDTVFLNGSAARTDDPVFLALVQGHAALLVRIGGPTEGLPPGEQSIPAPFTNDVIVALLDARRLSRTRK